MKGVQVRIVFIIFAVKYKKTGSETNWLDRVIDFVLPWVAVNTAAEFGMYILDMDNPRYFYNRVGQLAGLCALLELVIYTNIYFIICLYWGFFFVLVPTVTLNWLKKIT